MEQGHETVHFGRQEVKVQSHARLLSCIRLSYNLHTLAMARQKAVVLASIWKDRNIKTATKVKVVKSMVWAVFQYGVEGWTLKKSDRNRTEAF